MLRRRLLLAFLTLLTAAEPASAQKWMGRYLQQRKAAQEGNPQGGTYETGNTGTTPLEAQEVRRATPVEAAPAAEVAPPPEIPPTATLNDELPVRRAEPVNPAATRPESPRRVIVPELEPTERPVLRVPLPVQRSAEDRLEEPLVRQAEPVLPAQPVDEAAPPPQPAAPPAQAERPSQPEPSSELDPGAREIRLSPGNASVPADAAQFFYANGLYGRKDYQRAAPEFERYLTSYPYGADRQAAYFRLAECYRQAGSRNAARKNYEALIYTFQTGDFIGPAAYRLAEICYQEKDFSAAVAFFRKASVWVKDPAIALSAKFYAARALENLRFTSDAIQAHEDVLSVRENNPFREASQLALVQLLDNSGRRRQALVLLDTLRKETEKPSIKAEATVRIGMIFLEQREYVKAAEELSRALQMQELGSWSEIAVVGLIRALYNSEKYQQALDTFLANEAGFSPNALPEVLLIAGNCQRQLGKTPEAQVYYDRVAREFPGSEHVREAQYQRLVGLYSTDSPDLIAQIDLYLTANPEAGEKRDQLTLMKAESLYKTRQYAAAAPLYASLEKASLPSAMQSEAIFKLGWCNAQIGDHPGAIQAFSGFLNRYPVNKLAPTALAQRASSYERVKNYKAALADFNDLLARYPKAKEREFALHRKALILGQLDESRQMVEVFNQLLKEFPKSPAAGQAQYWIGLTAFQAKNYKDSVAPLTAARKLDKEIADKATALLLAAKFYLEDRDALAAEVDSAGPKTKVPTEILRWLGGEYLKAQNATAAEKYLTRLSSDSPEEVVANDWLNLGQARTQLGKWREAEGAIRGYLKLENEPLPQAAGYLALGQAQLGAKSFAEAQESANKVMSFQAEGRLNARGRILSGDIAVAKGEYEAGAKLYQSTALVFDDPQLTPKALEKAHLAYKQAGNETQAAKVLNELQTRYPEYPLNLPSPTAAQR